MALRAGRLPSAILIRWVLILILGGAVGYWGWQKFKPKVPLQDKSSTRFNLPVTDQNLLKGLLEIEAQQNQLDRTVWATESLAEEHEDVFIKLWDDLRSNEDEYSILEQFRFRELLLGKPGLKKSHEHGIVEFRLDQSPEKIGTESWRLLLKELKENGYRIEQTEWRHAQFDPGPPATSIVYLEAHVHNDTGNERFILRGNLRVEWEEGPDPRGARVAARIDATGISVVSRQGDTAFRAALSSTLAPEEGTIFIDPLIVYDLDGDGLSEIILGCKNLVFRNRGHGTFQKETLCRPSRGLIGTCIVADFDGDGLADFLAADRDGLLLYRGDKEGRFTQGGRRVWSSSEPLLNPFVMTAGDIDGDGDLDV